MDKSSHPTDTWCIYLYMSLLSASDANVYICVPLLVLFVKLSLGLPAIPTDLVKNPILPFCLYRYFHLHNWMHWAGGFFHAIKNSITWSWTTNTSRKTATVDASIVVRRVYVILCYICRTRDSVLRVAKVEYCVMLDIIYNVCWSLYDSK